MKKSVLLMAGLMAMALAGSAQAATMFAVQDAAATDKMVVTDTGWIGIGTPPTGPITPFHVVSSGNTIASAGFNYTFTNTGTVTASKAPNFTFYRNNDPTAVNATNGAQPRADDTFGVLQFGSIVNAVGKLSASIAAKAEGTATATVSPGYITLSTAYDNAGVHTLSEKVRITSVGNVGVGTIAPTSKLQVVGLPVFADNAAALLGGLTAGAFYRTATGVLMVAF